MGKARRRKKVKTINPPSEVLPTSSQRAERLSRIKRWLVGSIIGILVLGIVGNHLSAVVPNPFEYLLRTFITSTPKNQTWFVARFQNKLPHDISVGIWSHADNLWRIKTVKASEILVLSESGIIYLQIQGDMIGDLATRRLTHTYEGIECYQLETSKFDSPPEQSDLDNAPLNRLEEIMGGPTPKTVTFLDKTKLQFELFGPSGIKLKIIFPVNDGEEGQAVYPFQLNSDSETQKGQ